METKQELDRDKERGLKVRGMIEHPGWTDVVKPELERMRGKAVQDILSEDDIDPIRRAKAKLSAVVEVLNHVENTLASGREAEDKLEKRKDELSE